MTITEERRGPVCILNLQGTFMGRPAVAVFERAMFELLRDEHRQVILNLNGLRFIDSAGLGAMISAMVSVGRREGALRLAAPRGDVLDIISRMNLDKVFQIFDTVDHAEAGFTRRRG